MKSSFKPTGAHMNGTMSHFKIKYLTWNSNLVNLSLVKYFEREREREREARQRYFIFYETRVLYKKNSFKMPH